MTSVRGDRSSYHERDDRDQDSHRRTYTTVRRYQIPDSNSSARSIVRDDVEESKKKIVIRRERKESSPDRDQENERTEVRVTERVLDRDPRRDISYRIVERDYDREQSRNEIRVIEREREPIYAPSPTDGGRGVREFRFERERDWNAPDERPYELERYSRSTEYFQQPQPIIIRERAAAPIIIREERREPQRIIIRREEPQYEFIERKEVEETKDESKSLVRAEEPQPTPTPVTEKPEEDYFYERKIIERRRRSESFDRRTEIRPRDSASQYSSDESYEYVRRERTYEESRSSSPHHKRNIAGGALAGAGVAEILRHHRKSKGEEPGSRGRDVLSGAAVGALGAGALSRVRSMRRSSPSSRSRSRSGEREWRERERHDRRRRRSQSRSWALTPAEKLGGLAAVAAVAGLAGYALNKNKKETVVIQENGPPPRRSRSRKRRGSLDSYLKEETKHADPEHRNRRIAQAGLVSAAVGAAFERYRSKSRGGHRSKSRVKQAIPIVASGLGGAALAGLYEKNQANKDAKKEAIIEDELDRGRRRRSRSRSVAASYDSRAPRGMINDRAHSDSEYGYYSDDEPGVYRRRPGSAGSSPDNRDRHRSRSRSRARLAQAAGAAGLAGIAAHEIGKRRERSRADKQRKHEDDDRYNDDRYSDRGPYSPQPAGHNQYGANRDQQQQQQQDYPGGHYFPPPPTDDYSNSREVPAGGSGNGFAPYNPADYANRSIDQPIYGSGAYGESTGNLNTPRQENNFGAGHSNNTQAPRDERRGVGREPPENVSSPDDFARSRQDHDDRDHHRHRRRRSDESQESDGMSPNRGGDARSPSRVRFDLDQNTAHFPEGGHRRRERRRHHDDEPAGKEAPSPARGDDRDLDDGHRKRRHRHRPHDEFVEDESSRDDQAERDRRQRHRHRQHDEGDEDDGREHRHRHRGHRDEGRDSPRTDGADESIIDNIKNGTGMTGGLLKTLASHLADGAEKMVEGGEEGGGEAKKESEGEHGNGGDGKDKQKKRK